MRFLTSRSQITMTYRRTGQLLRDLRSVETLKFVIDGYRTIEEDRMAGFFRLLRRWRGRDADEAIALAPRHKPQWQVVESVASPALGSVYAQVLRQAGIPVLTRDWGAGAGAMGGVSIGVRVMVPEDRIEDARAVLDAGMAISEADDD